MKYIRTKEGVYELANERTITEFQVIDYLHNRAFLKSDIIAQANTIEELCDEFVVFLKNTRPYIADTFQRHELLTNRAQLFKFYGTEAIYGAIWTDKGLIYVAKLNNKGEFELI